MRVLPIRTISGRIVLGFLVLVCTFGALGVYVTVEMRALSRDLKFIRQAYLDIVVLAARVHALQSGLLNELDEEQPRRPLLKSNRNQRQKLFDDIDRQLNEIVDVPARYRPGIARMRAEEARVRQDFDAILPAYELYLASSDRTALGEIKTKEHQLAVRISRWFSQQRNLATQTVDRLANAERQARLGAIVLGAVAGLVALLVTLWSVLTLQPIQRLRDGARRVAQGEYRERVAVVGETEVAEVAREFNAMAAAIEEREQELVRQARLAAVGKMAAIITHEIRNPLSSIGLNAELLQEELDAGKGEAATLCRKITKEVDRLTAITEEYLRFARLPRPKLVRAEVNEIVTDLVEFQREELGLAGVQVSSELGRDLPPVAADEGQLRQALLNLVRNAADAMSSQGGGTLKVATRSAADGAVEVAVVDDGPGIAPAHLPRIFEPFFSTKEKGTGLGLALTQQIVLEHGGRLEVDSAPGKGTTFVVKLPAARAG